MAAQPDNFDSGLDAELERLYPRNAGGNNAGSLDDELERLYPSPKPTLGDYGKAIAAGAAEIPAAASSGLRMLGADRAADYLGSNAKAYREDWTNQMTPAGKAAMTAPLLDDKGNLQNWRAIPMAAAESLPGTIAMGGIGKLATLPLKAMGAAEAIAPALTRLGMGAPRAAGLADSAVTGLAYGGAEGVFSGLGNAEQKYQEIQQTPAEQMALNPNYQAMMQSGLSDAEARNQLGTQAMRDVFGRTALSTGGISALTGGGMFGQLENKVGGGLLSRVGKGMLSEGVLQEGPQSFGESVIGNLATQQYGNPNQGTFEGTLNETLTGLGAGALMGGVAGIATGEQDQPAGLGSQWETPAFTNYPRQPDVPPTSPVGMTPEEAATVQNPLTVEPPNVSSDARQSLVNVSSDARNAETQGLGSRWQKPAFTLNPNQPVLGDVLAGAPDESTQAPVAPGTDRVGSPGPEAAAVDPIAAGGPDAGNEPGDGLLSSTRQFNTAPGLATDPAPAAPPSGNVAGSPGAEAGQPNRDVLDAGQGAVDEAQNTGLVDQAKVEERKPWHNFVAEEPDPATQARILRFVVKRTQDPQDLAEVLDMINPKTMGDAGNVAWDVLKKPQASDETKAKAKALYEAIPDLKNLDEPADAKSADDWLNIHKNTRTVYDAEGIPRRVAAEQPPARGREEVTGTIQTQEPTDAAPTPRDLGSDATGLSGGSRPTGAGELGVAGGTELSGRGDSSDGTGGTGAESPAAAGLSDLNSVDRPALAPQFTETDKDNRFKLTNVTDLGGTEAVRARLKEAGVKVPGNALDDNTLQFHSSQRDNIFKALEPTNDEQNQLSRQPEQPARQEEGTQAQAQEEVGQAFGDITYDNIKGYLTDNPDDDTLEHVAQKFDIAPSMKNALPDHAVIRVASMMGYKKTTTLLRDMNRDKAGNTIRDVVDYVNSKTSEGKAKNKQARADKLAYESAVSLANSRMKDQSNDDIDYQIATTESSRQNELEKARRYDERAASLDAEWKADRASGNRSGVGDALSAIGQGPFGLRQQAIQARSRAKDLQKKIVELAKSQKAANAPNQPAPVVPQATQPTEPGADATLATQAEANQASSTAQVGQPDEQGDDTATEPAAPAKAPWDDLASRGESWKEDRWHNTRVQVAPSMRGDTTWEGTVTNVLKTSSGQPWLEVRRDGQDGSVRVTPDRISVLDLKDSEATPAAPAVTPEAQQKPEPGIYQPTTNVSSKAGQIALADRGGRLAMLDGLNQQVEKTNPTAAYSPDEIQNAADDRIDSMRDWLISQQKPAAQPNAVTSPVTGEAPTLNIAQRGQFNGANSVRKAMGKPALTEAEWLAEQRGTPAASRQEAGAAATRTKPKNTIQFSNAITGPSGAKMDSYTWQWREEDQADRNGEMRPRRVSDWEKAGTSDDTGRDIVHQFMVTKPDGSQQMMSAESAIKALGYAGADTKGVKEAVTTSKTLARLQMASEQAAQSIQTLKQDIAEINAAMPEPVIVGYEYGRPVYKVGDGESASSKGFAKQYYRADQLKKRGWDVGDSGLKFLEKLEKKAESIQDRLAKAQSRLDGILSRQAQPPAESGQAATTAEQAIRDAADQVPNRTIGSWYPITVSHSDRTQQFMSNIKRVRSDGKTKPTISLAQVKPGRLIAGEPIKPLFYSYKLTKDNNLVEEGVPRYASEAEIKRWEKSFGKVEAEPQSAQPTEPKPTKRKVSQKARAEQAAQTEQEQDDNDIPRFSREQTPTNQTETEAFKQWSRNAPLVTSEAAPDYPFKTGSKVVVEAYHGTGRPDRVGTVFNPKRATSGPMAFHTSDKDIASGYAKGKPDTSLAYEDTDFANWFKYKPKGQRSAVPIDRAWYSLDPAVRAKIAEMAPQIAWDDDAENIVIQPGNTNGIGNYDWEVKQARGNHLKALVESWLMSGSLYDQEEMFMSVLQKAGFPVNDVTYDSPHATFPFVYKNFIRMSNPLVTTDIPQDTMNVLNEAAKRDRSRPKLGGADAWDKNTRTLREWVKDLNSLDETIRKYVWTSIPDKVTDVLKALGYDGIIDWSGKGGGTAAPVYIPFTQPQIKSGLGNKGTFKDEKKDILFSRAPTFYSQLARAFDSAKSNTMPGNQWASWIKGNAAKLGVKADEIAWTGIDDYLTLRAKEKVSKQEIAEYLSQNGVQVDEVMRGEDNVAANRKALDEVNDKIVALYAKHGVSIGEPERLPEPDQSELKRLEREFYQIADAEPRNEFTKFESYTIPGGENYRELLITLPASSAREKADAALESFRSKVTQRLGRTGWDAEDLTASEYAEYERLNDAAVRASSDKPAGYRSSHWDEPNVLAHLRFDERADADGNRVMFIQELQSDWGQEGKRKGFASNKKVWLLKKPGDKTESSHDTKEEAEQAMRMLARAYGDEPSALGLRVVEGVDNRVVAGLPPAPFVTDTKAWVSLALKRAIRHAAENGFDKIAFANGQQNADLYDLSKQISSIEYSANGNGTYDVRARDLAGDNTVWKDKAATEQTLTDTLGKEIADKIVSGEGESASFSGDIKRLSGLDLKVGGEGMRYFYDSLIPSVANDVLKKLGGGRVGKVSIGTGVNTDNTEIRWTEDTDGIQTIEWDGGERQFDTEEEAQAFRDRLITARSDQPGFTLTPELREKALGGLPLFARPGRPVQQKVGAVLSRDAVQARINAIRPKLRINPKVTIRAVDSEAELPADIQAQARKEGAVGQVIAVHQGNSIFLVAGKHDSAAKIEESILHESNHYGANVLFGRAKHAIYNRLFNQLGGEKGIRDYANRLGLKMEPYFATARESRGNLPDMRVNSYLVDEFLANAQGTKAYATLPQKIKTAIQEFYGAIRNWLRQQGFAELAKFTDADLAYLLRSIHKAAQGEVASGRGKPMFMVAWHGSPHDHDKFSTSKIGTGEGNQAFGWGLYFSNTKDIAKHYREMLSRHRFDVDGTTYDVPPYLYQDDPNYATLSALLQIDNATYNVKSAKKKQQIVSELIADEKNDAIKAEMERIGLNFTKSDSGRLYQVELAPAEDEYLDWHKPLSEQSEKVRGALDAWFDSHYERVRSKYGDRFSRSDIAKSIYPYESIKADIGRGTLIGGDYSPTSSASSNQYDKAASEYLHSLGIRGIRYPAEGQTGGKSGDRFNYVIFDENDIEITAKFSRQKDINKPVRQPGNPLTLIKNPTFAKAYAVAKSDRFGEIRLVRDPTTGDVYIAPAASTLHELIADVAGLPHEPRNPASPWYNSDDLAIIKADHIYRGVYDRYFAESAEDAPMFSRSPTIEVDGTERPTTNSEGRPILAFDGENDSFSSEILGDGLPADAEFLRNLADTRTFSNFGLDGFDIPSKRVVLNRVFSVLQDNKVFDAVVQLVPIDMVNVLTGQQGSAQVLGDNVSMLKNLLSSNSDDLIAASISEPAKAKAAAAIARVTAKYLTTNPDSRAVPSDNGSAPGTRKVGFPSLAAGVAGVSAENSPAGGNFRSKTLNAFPAVAALESFHKAYPIHYFSIAYNQNSGLSTIRAFSPDNNDIRFSRQYTPEQQAAQDDAARLFAEADATVKTSSAQQRAGEELEKSINKLSGTMRREALGALTVQQLVETGERLLPRMKDYLRDMTGMDVTRNKVLYEVDGIAKGWENLDTKTQARLAYVMHESTIAGVDGSEAYQPVIDIQVADKRIKALKGLQLGAGGDPRISQWQQEAKELRTQIANERNRLKARDRINALYAALPKEAKQVYKQARDYHVGQSKRVENALVTMIQKSMLSARQKSAAITQLRRDFESQRVNAPYFPLGRDGDYWVSVRNADGNGEFVMFDTIEEQERAVRDYKAQGLQVAGYGKKGQNLQQVLGVSASFVADVESLIGELGAGLPQVEEIRDQVYQLYLRTLPELSSRKHFIHRQKTPGFGKDALRSFVKKGYHDAYQYARVKHGFDLRNTMEALAADVKAATSDAAFKAAQTELKRWSTFKEEVLEPGLTASEVRERADFMLNRWIDVQMQSEGRSLSVGERYVKDEYEQWKQFKEWMDLGGQYGGMAEHVERKMQELTTRIDGAKTIRAERRGYETAQNYYEELQQAYETLMHPASSTWANTVNQIGYLWHLAFSPAAWITNATQTPLITMPFVASKFGMGKTTAAFQKAYKEAMQGATKGTKEHALGIRESLSSKDEIDAYDEAMERGLIERGRAMDLAGLAEEGADRSAWHRKFAMAMTFGFHDAERLNREVSFMASYRLAKSDGLSHEAAVDYAAKVVNDTHFNYTAENRPRFLRGDIMRVLGQFKLYSQHVTYLQWRALKQALGKNASAAEKQEARRFLMFQTGVQLAAGGVMGLPLGIWATAAVGGGGLAVANRYGWKGAMAYAATVIAAAVAMGSGDDDDPKEWEAEFQQAMADWLGQTGGAAVSKGIINAIGGIDLSTRVSQADLWWRGVDADIGDRQYWGEVLSQASGAGLGTIPSFIQGVQMARDGDIWRGIEKMTPKVIKDAMQSLRFADEGAITMKGDALVPEFAPWELAGKAAGFQPSRLAARYEENRAEKNRESAIEQRRSRILGNIADGRIAYAKARQKGDQDAMQAAQEDVKSGMADMALFNKTNPRFRITPDSIMKSVKSRNQARAQAKDGVILNRKIGERYSFAE